jgi:calcium-dependent protein kinase
MGNICYHKIDDTQDPSIGQTKSIEEFDRNYESGSIIGVGQFSEVKQAKSALKSVAVKCIKLSTIRNDLHLLKREITLMHKIKHPNIVELYDVYENSDFFYITMELCDDNNLRQKVTKFGPMSVEATKYVSKKLLLALQYLHSKNICHRDIKPENILFVDDEPKIADFGLARFMSGTKKFSMVGTPYYLAPEVISGDYNTKCDIWSLGVVIYFALTGKKPFVGDGYEELFVNIQETEIDWADIPDDAQDFLRYLLRKNHKIRPSAQDAITHKWLVIDN